VCPLPTLFCSILRLPKIKNYTYTALKCICTVHEIPVQCYEVTDSFNVLYRPVVFKNFCLLVDRCVCSFMYSMLFACNHVQEFEIVNSWMVICSKHDGGNQWERSIIVKTQLCIINNGAFHELLSSAMLTCSLNENIFVMHQRPERENDWEMYKYKTVPFAVHINVRLLHVGITYFQECKLTPEML